MQHRDLRGGMAPDLKKRTTVATATAIHGGNNRLTLYPGKYLLVTHLLSLKVFSS
jgi:hypothetical protein